MRLGDGAERQPTERGSEGGRVGASGRHGSVSGLEWEDIDPGLVGRCEWELEETRKDVEVLAWVGRFRFVTAEAVAERFGVSVQAARGRVRRLERVGLVGRERQHVSQPWAVFVTAKGHEFLGWNRRRAPRAEVQREHEAAIVWLATQLEFAGEDGVDVLTERECRRREAAEQDERFSVEVAYSGRARTAGAGRISSP